MPEVYAALIGAAATALVMILSNISNRREREQNRRQDTITCAMFGKTNKLCTKY